MPALKYGCRIRRYFTCASHPGSIELTQKFMGQMLVVQRSSVSIVAGTLQHAGTLRYRDRQAAKGTAFSPGD